MGYQMKIYCYFQILVATALFSIVQINCFA